MKKFILALFVFAIGLGAGGYGGYLFAGLKYGRKAMEGVRFYDETRLLAYGTNAFAAYLHETPDVGIYELRYHLSQLDERVTWAGSNLVFINNRYINWMRGFAH